MARKRLIKGPNALRVEKRIAEAPEDITETSIFQVLKNIEEKSKKTNTKKETTSVKAKVKAKNVEKTEKTEKTKTKKPSEEKEKKVSKKSIHFTKQEKEIILKSCVAYRNTLPIYLKSVQREVKIIDSVIKKVK